MSAFMVGKETINWCVWALSQKRIWGFQESRNELGRKLWMMNGEAIRQRYDDEPSSELSKYEYSDPKNLKELTLDEQIVWGGKQLHCLRYQCSEGNIPDTEFYKALDSEVVAFDNCYPSAQGSIAYDAAPWAL